MSETEVEHGELHFSYSGEWIQDAARSAYWFENRRPWALKVLGCIRIPREYDADQIFYMQSRGLSMEQIWEISEQLPLNEEQIGAILNGRARLTEDSKFVRENDVEFQVELNKWHEDFVEVGEIMVRRISLDNYLKSIERSRNVKESSPAYERILQEVGFVKLSYSQLNGKDDYRRPKVWIANTPDSLAFRSALLKVAELHLRAVEAASK